MFPPFQQQRTLSYVQSTFKMFDIQTLFLICSLEKEKEDMQSSKKTIHKVEIIDGNTWHML